MSDMAESRPARGTTVAEAITATLQLTGVKYVFGMSGHANLALLDALRHLPEHELYSGVYLCAHEEEVEVCALTADFHGARKNADRKSVV